MNVNALGKKGISLLRNFSNTNIQASSMPRQNTRAQLIEEIEGEEFHLSPIQGKIMLNDAEEIIEENKGKSLGEIKKFFSES